MKGSGRQDIKIYTYLSFIMYVRKNKLDANKKHLSIEGHLQNSKVQNYPVTH